MIRLVVESVASSSMLRRSLSPGQAKEYGDFDGETLTVASEEDADALINRYPNVRYAEPDGQSSVEPESTRLEADNDGVHEVTDDDTTEYPTNSDGEPLCVGKSDGQCSRTVDEPNGVCWQHQTE